MEQQSFSPDFDVTADLRFLDEVLDDAGLDTDHLFGLMRKHHTFISGSVVLAYANPGLFTPGDIDLYTTPEHVQGLLDELTATTGYIEVPPPAYAEEAGRRYGMSNNSDMVDVKWLEDEARGKKMNIVVVDMAQPLFFVFQFYTTLVMNVITPDGVGLAYPALTLAGVGVLADPALLQREKYRMLVEKYENRGFTIAETWSSIEVTGCLDDHECPGECQAGICAHEERDEDELDFFWFRWTGRDGDGAAGEGQATIP